MNRPPFPVRAQQLLIDALGVLTVLLPYWAIVGTCRATRWLVTVGVPHGLFYLVVALLLTFVGIYLAVRYALTHGPDLISALAGDLRRLTTSGWSRVGRPARFVLGGTAAVLALFAVVFTLLSAI
jgi:hypothetical protein